MILAHPALAARRPQHATPTIGATVWIDGEPVTIIAIVDDVILCRCDNGEPDAFRVTDDRLEWVEPADIDPLERIAELEAAWAARAAEVAGELPPITYRFRAGKTTLGA